MTLAVPETGKGRTRQGPAANCSEELRDLSRPEWRRPDGLPTKRAEFEAPAKPLRPGRAMDPTDHERWDDMPAFKYT